MATTSFSRTSGTPTNALKWTYSVWVKLSELIDGDRWLLDFNTDSNNRSQIGWTHDNSLPQLIVYEKVSSSTSQLFTTTQGFRDLGAFYNIVVSCDRTLATQEDRTKIYINGERVTDFHTTPNYPAQNVTGIINTAVDTLIGKYSQSTVYYDGLMSYVSFVDGTAYDASYFGETDSSSGIWKIKTVPSVTWGNNGFFLKMDTSSPGTDTSGNNNTFTASGTPTLTQDNPSNNFPIINKTMQPMLYSNATISNGGTTNTSNTSDYTLVCTMGATKGKWYWEVKMGNAGNTRNVGVVRADQLRIAGNSSGFYPGGDGNATNFTSAWNGSTGFVQTNTAGTQVQVTSGVTTTTTGDILGVALDLDSYTINFYKNGSADGTGTLSSAWVEDFVLPCARADHTQIMQFNFGNGFFGTTAVASSNADAAGYGLFEYAVPTGYYTLCTKNLNTYG